MLIGMMVVVMNGNWHDGHSDNVVMIFTKDLELVVIPMLTMIMLLITIHKQELRMLSSVTLNWQVKTKIVNDNLSCSQVLNC